MTANQRRRSDFTLLTGDQMWRISSEAYRMASTFGTASSVVATDVSSDMSSLST
jgi:hypothetical protein